MEQLVNFVIRPPRADYCPDTDLLDDEFTLRGKLYTRKDLEVTNKRGDILKCSHYLPVHTPGGKPLPCVIYCHGNSGCRVDASEAAIILLPSNITVFTLDFSGSGLSGGDYVSLGWNEKDDLRAVVDYLRAEGNVSLIGLWGRSMGAVTSLMYAAEDPSIAGMVLDSPFSVLVDLMMELVDTYNVRLPKFTVKFAIQFMRRAIMKKAKFDITGLDAVKVAKTCFVPALFGHAIDDEFVLPHHSDRIFEAYMGDKNIIKFEGDHNSPRPQFYFDSINIFFHNVLQPPEDEIGGTFSDNMHYYFGKSSQGTEHGLGYGQRNSTLSKEVATRGSTAEAINELRSKQSMSKTEVPFDHRRKGDQSEEEDFLIDGDSRASSSGMINFELSNGGHPYGPHVPIAFDDDQYVEFQLDDLTGFPCSAHEEEKMLMEAIRESLKDVEIRGQNTRKEPTLDSRTDSFGSSLLRDVEASSATETSAASKTDDSASSSAVHGERPSLEAAAVSSSSSSSSSQALIIPSPPSNNNNTITENNQGSAHPITAPNIAVPPPNEDADVSSTTKATVSVVKNPSSHILDGLLRRWDFNCFRGGR